MARYRMDDGTIIDTQNASNSWQEARDWNGSNHIGRSSRSQWHDQTLHCSRKGRYYIEHTSRVQGQTDHCEWVSNMEATRWLLHNEVEIPGRLAEYVEQVTE